jgi:hypothetical protein
VELVQTWTRRAGAAAGASLLVPFVVILASAVLALGGGGLGGLGALGDLVNGPDVPLADVAAAGVDVLAEQPATLLGTGRGGGPAGTGGPAGLGGDGAAGGGAAPQGGGGAGDGGSGDGGSGDGGPGGGDGGGGDDGGGGPGPGDDPGPPRDIVDDGRDLADGLPAPVGPLTGEAIDQAIDATEGLLPRGALPPAP